MNNLEVVILAGGRGTRMEEVTSEVPKPMIEIGNKPILWHLMKIYSYFGINEFIICLGYKGFLIKKELQSILNLYAKMVSNGSWKDYSFTSGVREVSFNVYQRASDKPVLRILKNLKPQYFNERYLIKDKNGIILKKSEDLNQLINKTSWNKLRLVK